MFLLFVSWILFRTKLHDIKVALIKLLVLLYLFPVCIAAECKCLSSQWRLVILSLVLVSFTLHASIFHFRLSYTSLVMNSPCFLSLSAPPSLHSTSTFRLLLFCCLLLSLSYSFLYNLVLMKSRWSCVYIHLYESEGRSSQHVMGWQRPRVIWVQMILIR